MIVAAEIINHTDVPSIGINLRVSWLDIQLQPTGGHALYRKRDCPGHERLVNIARRPEPERTDEDQSKPGRPKRKWSLPARKGVGRRRQKQRPCERVLG